MFTLCTILSPFINSFQQLVNIIWFPLSFFGSPAPSVGSAIGPILGCTF